jgi:hypothetical protein
LNLERFLAGIAFSTRDRLTGTDLTQHGAERSRPRREGETRCDKLHGNAAKWTDAVRSGGAKNRRKRSGSKRTEMGDPLSGPRYRGSNPCLPANLKPFRINNLARLLRAPERPTQPLRRRVHVPGQCNSGRFHDNRHVSHAPAPPSRSNCGRETRMRQVDQHGNDFTSCVVRRQVGRIPAAASMLSARRLSISFCGPRPQSTASGCFADDHAGPLNRPSGRRARSSRSSAS